MSVEHDWHLFDAERGYEVRQVHDDQYEVRDADGNVTSLTAEEFEQLREEGPSPLGLN